MLWNSYTDEQRKRLINLQRDTEVTYAQIESKRFWDNYANDPLLSRDEQSFMMEVAARAAAPIGGVLSEVYKRINSPNRGGNREYQEYHIVFNYLGAEEVGLIVMNEILKGYLTKWATHDERDQTDSFTCSVLQNLARTIGDKLLTAARFRQSREDNEGMFKAWSVGFKNWDNKKAKTFARKYSEIENPTKKMIENIGTIALELVIKNEALQEYPLVRVEKVTKVNNGSKKTTTFVFPAHEILIPVINATGSDAIISRMVRNPMLVPPVPHAHGQRGGYLEEMFRGKTVKTSGHAHEGRQSTCSDMNYRVINSLQETEWAINPMVLETMAALYYNNHGQCNLPLSEKVAGSSTQGTPFPDGGTKEEQREWCEAEAALWDAYYKATQARAQMETRLGMAGKFVKHNAFYHQYHYDFRGRVYATCQMLSPQAGDLDRGLVYYANEYDIDDDSLYDICINVANLFDGQGPEHGFQGTASDKDTFDERVDWVWSNLDQFRQLLSDPIEHLHMWEDDARFKNTSFQRLSAAEDIIRAVDTGKSRVPVQFDGSCNGYQHWAAMTRDEVSGPEVNLVPRERPGDLYKLVARGMDTLLDSLPSDDPYISAFKDYYGPDGVPRKATKRVVMCDPYGLKDHSMKTYIIVEGHLAWCDTHDWRFAGPDFTYVETRAATKFAEVLKQGLHLVNQRSEQGKQYVMYLTDVCTQAGKPLSWTTPSGFEVVNSYHKQDKRDFEQRIFLSKGDQWDRIQRQFAVETQDLNGPKMKTTIPPNYVHSLDAAHLQLVVDRLAEAGCQDFSMIHDSFGCPAPYAAMMRNMIRTTFYEIHCESQLLNLKTQVEEQLGVSVRDPEPFGELDILDVLRAEYIFA